MKKLILFLILHLIAWVVIPFSGRDVLDRYGDMVENYVWGQGEQLGYYKHPPFFAFVAFNFLKIFGTNNLSYFLLSQINIVIGMVAIYFLANLLLKDKKKALLAVLLLEFIPFYGGLGIKFNANSILLSLYPLATLFFVRAIQKDKVYDWALLGFFTGLCFLSKYSSVILFLSFIVTLFWLRVKFYTNYKFYLCGIVGLVTIAPHIWWLLETNFMSLKYLDSNINTGFPLKPFNFIFAQIAYLAVVTAFVVSKQFQKPEKAILSLTFMPSFFMFIMGIVMNLETTSTWGIPNWFLFTTFLLATFKVTELREKIITIASFSFLILVIIGGFVNLFFVKKTVGNYMYPIQNLVSEISNDLEIKYITGDKTPSYYTAFYNKSHPLVLIDFNYEISPWVKPEEVKRHGIIITCEQKTDCIKKAEIFIKESNLNCTSKTLEKHSKITLINCKSSKDL